MEEGILLLIHNMFCVLDSVYIDLLCKYFVLLYVVACYNVLLDEEKNVWQV